MPLPATDRKTILNNSAAAAHLQNSFQVGYLPGKAAGAQVMQSLASRYQGDDVNVFSLHSGHYKRRR